jgi:hypothetical protein
VQLHRKPGVDHVFHERVEGIEPRLRAECDTAAVAAHRSEQAAHPRERRAPGLLDAPERLPVVLEGVRELVSHGADLEHHHAHGMGDDVMKLAGDPRALLGHRDPCGGLSLALGEHRAHLRRLSFSLGK